MANGGGMRSEVTGRFTESGTVNAIVFSSDGRTIATVYGSYRATLWDAANGVDPVKVATIPLQVHNAGMTIALGPNGRTLITGAADPTEGKGSAALWDLTDLTELRDDPTVQACAMTGRGLTEDEWARHIPELPHRATCPG